MDGAPGEGRQGQPAEALAQVIYSPQALGHIERALEFLATADAAAAVNAAGVIREAIGVLANHPMIGRAASGKIRELVISFGATGYIALYRYIPARNEVRILALKHQRELDYPVP